MENLDSNVQVENSFIGKEINDYLMETSKWGKFLAIIGYIGLVLLILMAFFMFLGFNKIGPVPNVNFPVGILGFVYIVIAILYFIPVNYLYKFSTQMKQGLVSNDMTTITSGFSNLKSLFKFMGIFTIVLLSLYVLILVIAIFTASMF